MAQKTFNEEPSTKKSSKPLKFLLHSFFATGHVLPMQAIAKSLVDRGHEVVFLTSVAQESRVLASGARFMPTSEVAVADTTLMAAKPNSDLPDAVEALFGGRLTAQVADLRRVLANFKADCLLNDALPQGAAAIYDLGEVPFFATLGVVPMYLPVASDNSSRLPVPGSGLGTILSQHELVLPTINLQRAKLGLQPLEASPNLHYSAKLHIQASCPALEFLDTTDRDTWPLRNLHFVGPLVTKLKTVQSVPSWWVDVESSSCVIGITQGTFAVDPSLLIIPAIEALATDTRKPILVVPSPHVDNIRKVIESKGIPMDNVRIAEWVPYDLLLPRCNLLITNGGYGSVTQALAHGIPIVGAGTTEDKKDTAARVTRVEAGIDLATDTPTPDMIREAVHKVLDDHRYRENAMRIAEDMKALGGAERACEILEEAVGRTLREQCQG